MGKVLPARVVLVRVQRSIPAAETGPRLAKARAVKQPLIFSEPHEVETLVTALTWFLETQDPELDDSVYDRNDEHLIESLLLPRVEAPFDVHGGTSKDPALLRQALAKAIEQGALSGAVAEGILVRLDAS